MTKKPKDMTWQDWKKDNPGKEPPKGSLETASLRSDFPRMMRDYQSQGKGDRNRVEDLTKYKENFERIFSNHSS